MRKLFYFLGGYVKVVVYGRQVGRFLNLCARGDIKIWQVRPEEEDTYSFYMRYKDVWEIKPFLRKTRCRIRIHEKKGLPFRLFKYRKRILFPIAFFLVVFLFGYCSQFVWRIELIGNETISQEELLSYLEEKQAYLGKKTNSISCEELELSLRKDFEEIIWATVYVEGTLLVVQVQEKLPMEEKMPEEDFDCSNIVATKDAVIYSIITRTGTPGVKAGDIIKTGDLLVTGTQEIYDDAGEVKSYLNQRAEADIIGEVTYHYKDTIPIDITVTNYKDSQKKSFFLEIAGRRITLPVPGKKYEQEEIKTTTYQMKLTSQFYLPVYVGYEEAFEVEENTITRTEDEIFAMAEENFLKFLADLEENGVLIIDKNVMIDKVGSNYVAQGTIQARESIGKEIQVEGLEIIDESE